MAKRKVSIPSVAEIKKIYGIRFIPNTDPDEAAAIIRQAMVWANEGKLGKKLEEYAEASFGGLPDAEEVPYDNRVQMAFQMMDALLEGVTWGFEYLGNTAGGGIIFLDHGFPGVNTVIYDDRTGDWLIAIPPEPISRGILGHSGQWYRF